MLELSPMIGVEVVREISRGVFLSFPARTLLLVENLSQVQGYSDADARGDVEEATGAYPRAGDRAFGERRTGRRICRGNSPRQPRGSER